MTQVNEALLELFRSHDVDCTLQGEWIVFPKSPIKANASVVREIPQQAGMSIQLDVQFEIAFGRTIVESFAGIGATPEAALADAFRNFALNSFHVFLAAFFRAEEDQSSQLDAQQSAQQVSQEEWNIGGNQRRVTIGNAGLRGKPPVLTAPMTACLEQVEQRLQGLSLSPETHWIRLYYAQTQGKSLAGEFLLDNEVWIEMQSKMASLDWPAAEAFYSMRIFLIIAGREEEAITPESAVGRLIELVTAHPEFTEDGIYQVMADAGIPEGMADRAYKFTQTAWGRLLLDGMKINFSSHYFCFDANGSVLEAGELAEERYFAAAIRLGSRYIGAPGFQRLALTSAEVNVINTALHKGSQPENLATAPVGVFVAAPTAMGLQNAQKVMAQTMTTVRE